MIPSVRMGKPAYAQDFNVYEVEGIDVYVNKLIAYSKELIDGQIESILEVEG